MNAVRLTGANEELRVHFCNNQVADLTCGIREEGRRVPPANVALLMLPASGEGTTPPRDCFSRARPGDV
eukprot:6291034-Alexandrium_andersonii.AAC.1